MTTPKELRDGCSHVMGICSNCAAEQINELQNQLREAQEQCARIERTAQMTDQIVDLPTPRIVVAVVTKHLAPYRVWKDGDHLLFMGEIDNMPGHGVFVERNGTIHWGHHPDEFRESTEDEL